MKRGIYLFIVIILCITCKKESTLQIRFVDEYVIKDSIQFKNTLIGGISGIDYNNGMYYMVIDDDLYPRVIKSKINIQNDTISSLDFRDVIHLSDEVSFFKDNALDLETIFIDEDNHINLASEGDVKEGKDPSIFSINTQGNFIGCYSIPAYFKANSLSKPRHNATFEASCKSYDKQGFWIGMEGVLESDGVAPSQLKYRPPARITYYDAMTKESMIQFAYPLDYIDRPSKGGFNVNGITAMLAYSKDELFVVERTYQSGYGTKGNRVRIYKVKLTKDITNTLRIPALKNKDYIPVHKELIFDFDTVRDQLTDGIVDNIEGITFGPKLSNGNQSLILVADDNFQKHGSQLNQFILLEIKS